MRALERRKRALLRERRRFGSRAGYGRYRMHVIGPMTGYELYLIHRYG